jgi:hypothetical protein
VADARAAGDAARTPACSGVAHSEQNLAVGGLTVPQVGQAEANPDPHSVQNFAPGRFSVPQTGQFMRRGAYRSRAADRDSSLGSEASWDGRQLVEALGRRRCGEAAVSPAPPEDREDLAAASRRRRRKDRAGALAEATLADRLGLRPLAPARVEPGDAMGG